MRRRLRLDTRFDRPPVALALALGAGIELVLTGIGVAIGSEDTVVATLLLGPLVVGLLAGPRETALVAVLGVLLGFGAAAATDSLGSSSFWVRVLVVAVGGALATVGAGARVRTGLVLRGFELLAAVGEVADGSLSLRQTSERLLDLVVPDFADLCILEARPDLTSLWRLGVRVEAPEREQIERALVSRRNDTSDGAHPAVATGQSRLLVPLSDEQLTTIAGGPDELAHVRPLALQSALIVPLRARGRLVGTLICAVGRSRRGFDAEDLRFAEVLAGRIALALDNAGLTATVTSLELQRDAALVNLAAAVTVQDSGGQTTYANAAAVELLQVESVEALVGSARGEVMKRFEVTYEDGRPVALADLPGSRALAGLTPEPLLVRNVVRESGEERWLLSKATPVLGADGGVEMVVNVFEDVTEVKRAEFAQRLLAQAGALLSSSLDYERTLEQVALLAVPHFADWCGVSMPGPDGVLRQVAVAHVDPEKVELARRLGERYPTRLSDETGAAAVIRAGHSQLFADIPDALLEESADDAEHAQLLRELQLRSVMLVPLSTGQETLGVLTFVDAESGRRFNAEDLSLAEELGRRAGIAVENARLYTERSRIAATLQRSLLPQELPEVSGWELASMYRPAGAENEVGGDFYDVFHVDRGWMVVVGDVAGRGVEAAALTALARYTLRAAGQLLGDPLAAVRRLNATLRERPELSLVSVCCILLSGDGVLADADVVCAGHPLPFLIRPGAGAKQVGAFGSFLGAFEDADWVATRVSIAAGEQLVLYTDGVIDTVGAHERFGEQRLGEVVSGARDADDAIERIRTALRDFSYGDQADDTAVLAVRRAHARAGEPSAAREATAA